MKGTPAQIMARLGVMAGILHGNRPYSNDSVRALYGRQPKRDFDGHNACIQCLSATTIKDCSQCVFGHKKAPEALARLPRANQNNQFILPRTTEKDNMESNSVERQVGLR